MFLEIPIFVAFLAKNKMFKDYKKNIKNKLFYYKFTISILFIYLYIFLLEIKYFIIPHIYINYSHLINLISIITRM